MTFIRNLRLRIKLSIMIITAVLFLVFIGFQGIYYVDEMSKKSEDMYQNRLLPVKWLNELKTNFFFLETKVLELSLATTETRNAQLEKEYNEQISINNQIMAQYEGVTTSEKQQEMYATYKEELNGYREIRDEVLQLARANKNEEAYALFSGALSKVRGEIMATLSNLIQLNEEEALQINKDNAEDSSMIQKVIISAILIAVILLVVIGAAINQLITRPIRTLQELMGKAAEGDLTGKGTYLHKDEIGKLTEYFNAMLGALRSLIDRINENALTLSASSQELSASAEQSARSSEEVAMSSQHLAEEFESQSNHVENAGEAVSLMSASIQEVENTAGAVSLLAGKAVDNSRNGYNSVGRINGQMNVIAGAVGESQEIINELGRRAAEIGSILTVINDIASQTNLLALNAAIEAARAGDSGRGFAVVADEVRKLAAQSSESSSHIAELIRLTQTDTERAIKSMNNGSQQVQEGLAITEETKGSFREIEDSVQKVSEMLEKVTESAHKLARGSAKMVDLMDKVNHVSQSGMAISQETAAASQAQQATTEEIENASKSLATLAEELQLSLQKFRV
jgi:methyl-accepting chemotaxis protein